MEYVRIILQLIVGLSLLNVWLLQNKKPTRWRGGNATTLTEEFQVYGLPVWMCYVVGFLKVSLSLVLLAGIFYPFLIKPAAIALAILLLGSIIMHLKIKDPLIKSFPAFLFLILCLVLIYLS
ncbi:DoxX-like family protein [Pricia antarctica]|uniref:DoxX-like family protein n=1 Tax=Pricia antarctica TaxID=641691 RepID=A0A1G7BZI0_9FLAO|nr:DoxX family protein [Pricia antarctica]SDE31826.1 DoxX-like family protein [Pricia antarctica]